jgi:hypothetical protein
MTSISPKLPPLYILEQDPFSADSDDVFVIVYALLAHAAKRIRLVLMITHFFADARAALVKRIRDSIQGCDDVPIFYDAGQLTLTDALKLTSGDARKRFLQENPGWPRSVFGMPSLFAQEGEKSWCKHFGRAFLPESVLAELGAKDAPDPSYWKILATYANQNMSGLSCEPLKAYESVLDTTFTVLALAPPHLLSRVNAALFKRMRIWCMGGGIRGAYSLWSSSNPRQLQLQEANNLFGYNWGLNTVVTDTLLKKVKESQCEFNVVATQWFRDGYTYGGDVRVTLGINAEWIKHLCQRALTLAGADGPWIIRALALHVSQCQLDEKLERPLIPADTVTFLAAFQAPEMMVRDSGYFDVGQTAPVGIGPPPAKGYISESYQPRLGWTPVEDGTTYLLRRFRYDIMKWVRQYLENALVCPPTHATAYILRSQMETLSRYEHHDSGKTSL